MTADDDRAGQMIATAVWLVATVDPLDLDVAFHEAVTEACMDLDRGYAERHPYATDYRRAALAHELCIPGEACVPGIGEIIVTFVAPGIRMRWVA